MIDEMEAVVPFLPNVESITLCSRDPPRDGRIRIVRRWQGAVEQVPLVLRPFASPDWLAWIDTAVWVPAESKVEWQHSPVVQRLDGLYQCRGTNFFDAAGNDAATRIRITGDLAVYPHKLPGVPRFLAPRLAPQIEKFLINLVSPNLTDLVRGLQSYLDGAARRRRGGRR